MAMARNQDEAKYHRKLIQAYLRRYSGASRGLPLESAEQCEQLGS
jgi:hypothetical protein